MRVSATDGCWQREPGPAPRGHPGRSGRL